MTSRLHSPRRTAPIAATAIAFGFVAFGNYCPAQGTPSKEGEQLQPEVTKLPSDFTLEDLAEHAAGAEPTETESIIFDLMGRAEAGDPVAQNQLGLLYLGDAGLPENPAEAFRLFGEAARAGNPSAMNNLAACYQEGIGTEPNDAEAGKWFRAGVAEGDTTSMRNLAEFLRVQHHGQSLISSNNDQPVDQPVDPEFIDEVLGLLMQATEAGDPNAMVDLGEWNQYGILMEPNPTKAAEWYEKALEIELIPDGQNNLGFLLQHGIGVERDLERAMLLYEQAGDQGHTVALRNRGWIARYEGPPYQNLGEARKWFERAAELGDGAAMVEIGAMLDEGAGQLVPDPDEAAQWFLMAAEVGEPEAMYRLGILAEEGRGLDRSPTDAIDWYTDGAQRGSINACFRLAEILAEGTYGVKDIDRAKRLFQLAARAGDEEAAARLAELDGATGND